MRAGRLQVGLENLLLQLNGSPYERFDEAEVTGLNPNQVVLFEQPPIPVPAGLQPVPVAGGRAGLATLVHNIAVRLEGPPPAPVPPGAPIKKQADEHGNLELVENIPAVLAAHRGRLRTALVAAAWRNTARCTR